MASIDMNAFQVGYSYGMHTAGTARRAARCPIQIRRGEDVRDIVTRSGTDADRHAGMLSGCEATWSLRSPAETSLSEKI